MLVVMVDLAGNYKFTEANSSNAKTKSTNSDLLVLNRCIHAFRQNKQIPFR